jgi:hypothetical protein
MFGNLLGSLIDKEKIIRDYLENTIEDVAEELNCTPDQVFIMIKPVSSSTNSFKVYLYSLSQGGAPKMVREMELKEFVSHEP